MQEVIATSTTGFKSSFGFAGILSKQGVGRSLTKSFSKPVRSAKVAEKIENGTGAFGSVKNIRIQNQVITVSMTFRGTLKALFSTVVVLDIDFAP